eukprot:scaffold19411_cov21-Prasinocladus_malaysianus.AAC.1
MCCKGVMQNSEALSREPSTAARAADASVTFAPASSGPSNSLPAGLPRVGSPSASSHSKATGVNEAFKAISEPARIHKRSKHHAIRHSPLRMA